MKEEDRKQIMTDLEDYCKNAIERQGETGKDWAFGAIRFAKWAGLITFNEANELDSKTWNRKETD